MQLKGTVLMLVMMILQIILNVIILVGIPELGLMVLIDTILIILTYVYFKKGVKGWAIFALVYGIVSFAASAFQGSFLNIGLGVMVAGIIALTNQTA